MASRAAASLHQAPQVELPVMEKRKFVTGIVSVRVLEEAGHAKIIVHAAGTSDYIGFIKLCQASESTHVRGRSGALTIQTRIANSLIRFGQRSGWCLWLLSWRGSCFSCFSWFLFIFLDIMRLPTGDCLSRSIDDNAIANKSSDHPVLIALAGDPRLYTRQAQVVVAVFTDAAVVMFVDDSIGAVVAVNKKSAAG